MAFPVSPTNGQTATVNGITYVYSSTYGSWTRTSSSLSSLPSLYIVGNVNAGNVTANSGTISTSTTTGALVVTGGAGVSGVLYIANTGDVSANLGTVRTNLNTLDANVGAYEIYANANLGTATTNITTLFSNAATQAISINTINANLGTATTNITTLFSNAATQATSINTIDANIGTISTSLQTLNANVGAYEIYANANLGTATTNITTLFSNAATQAISITSLATGANANTAAYLPSVTTLAGLTSFGAAAATTTAQGSLTVVGNLTIQGNTLTIGSNNLTVTDSVIDLHTYANLAALVSNDGRDIGIRFHYYKTSDKHAFIGWENATEALTYYQDATETNGVITGTLGNVELGSLYVSNTTATTSTTTGALQVSGGVGIQGNSVIAGNLAVGATSISAANPRFQVSATWPSATAAEQYGSMFTTTYQIADTSLKQGIRLNTQSTHSSGTIGSLISSLSLITAGGAGGGTVTNLINYWSRNDVAASVTATSSYNFYVNESGGAGSPVNNYGLYVQSLTKGTALNYAVFTAGTTPSYFGGNIIAGATTSSSSTTTGALVVTGGVGVGGIINTTGINVVNGLADGGGIKFQSLGFTEYEIDNSSGSLRVFQPGVNRLTLDKSGNLGVANSAPVSNLSVTGTTWTSGNINTGGWIVPTSNVSQNLGTTTNWWGTFYGVSTQAKYADLAENYVGDTEYAPGTVLVFGGEQEVTITTVSHDTRVAGVVSTNPAYLMNAASGNVAVAMTGRVPCQVLGPVNKGTVLVTSNTAGVAQALDNTQHQPGCVIGKALEQIDGTHIKTIEVVVGRF